MPPAPDNDAMPRLIAGVGRKAAAGDLEARLPGIGESDDAKDARTAINGLPTR
jgi:hypothetical protein